MKKKLLLTSILSVIMCMSLIVGATFALFTSESNVNIAVQSGKVSITAVIDEKSVETKQLNADYTSDTNNMYEGVATFGEEGLTLEKLVPGDGIKFNIIVTNDSDVTVKYRTVISCTNDDGLFAGLKITIGDNENYSGLTLVSDWEQLTKDSEDEIVPVEIELPEDAGNEYQEKTCTISYYVEAIQGNAQVENPEDGVLYIWNANDMKALSGKYLVANNGKAEIQNVELMANVDLKGAEFKEIGVAYGDTLNFKGNGYTISNMKLATGRHNGMTNVGMFYVDSGATLNVENLKLVAPVVEDAIDAYATGAAAVVGYANGAVNLTNVDVESAKINNTFGNAAIYVGYGVNAINLTDCDIIGADTTASGEIEDGAVRMDKTGAFVATANTASCVATLTNCTNESALNIAGRVINGAIMTVDGAYYVITEDDFTRALSSGNNDIILAEGTFNIPNDAQGKTLNITGVNTNSIIEVVPGGKGEANGQLDYSLDGSTVTFNNLTIKTNSQLYAGFARLSATYNDCVIQNTYNLGVGTSEFNNCTFNIKNEYLRVSGAYSATFNGCTFNTDGRAILVFQDGTKNEQTVTVKDCTFNATAPAKTWNGIHVSAVSYDGSQGGTYVVNFEGNNVVDGNFNGLWQIKGGEANVTVNGLN